MYLVSSGKATGSADVQTVDLANCKIKFFGFTHSACLRVTLMIRWSASVCLQLFNRSGLPLYTLSLRKTQFSKARSYRLDILPVMKAKSQTSVQQGLEGESMPRRTSIA